MRKTCLMASLCLACLFPIASARADSLTDSGFKRHRLSEQKIRSLHERKLTPHKFVKVQHKGHTKWIYFDPLACRCLYSGDDKVLNGYKSRSWAMRSQEMDYIRGQNFDNWLDDDAVGVFPNN